MFPLGNFTPAFMKNKHFFFAVYAIILSVTIFGIVFLFFQKNIGPAERTSPHNKKEALLSPEDSLALTQQINPINISIEGTDRQTVKLSWNDSKTDVFRVALFDAELLRSKPEESLIWAITSVKTIPNDGSALNLTRENMTGFISSGYIAGTILLGFSSEPSLPGGVTLTPGREYILQLNGLEEIGAEDTLVLTNKTFTFTKSCLAPDCLPAGDVPKGHK